MAFGSAATLLLKLQLERKQFTKEMTAANKDVDNFKKKSATAISTTALKSAGIVFAGLSTVIAASTKTYLDNVSAVKKLVSITGLSAESASLLNQQYQRYGLNADIAGKSIGILSKKIVAAQQDTTAGTAAMQDFVNLGLTPAQVASDDVGATLEIVRQRIGAMGAGAEKNAAILKYFGKAGLDSMKWINASAADIAKLNEQTGKMGLVISDADFAKAKQLAEAQFKLKQAIDGIMIAIARSGVIDVFAEVANDVADVMSALRPIAPALVKIGLAVSGVVLVVGGLYKAWQTFQVAVMAFKGIQTILTDIGLLKTALATTDVLGGAGGAKKGFLSKTLSWITDMVGYIVAGLSAAFGWLAITGRKAWYKAIEFIFKGTVTKFDAAWALGHGKATQVWPGFSKLFEKLKIPKLSKIFENSKFFETIGMGAKFLKFFKFLGIAGVLVGAISDGLDLAKEKAEKKITGFWANLKFDMVDWADRLSFGILDGILGAIDKATAAFKTGGFRAALDALAKSLIQGLLDMITKNLPGGDWLSNKLKDWLTSSTGITLTTPKVTMPPVPKRLNTIGDVPLPPVPKRLNTIGDISTAADAAKQDIATIATSVADVIKAIESMPKSTQKMAVQNWHELGVALRKAMKELVGGFGNVTEIEAASVTAAATVADGVAGVLNAVKSMPKKAVKLIEQDFAAIGSYVRKGGDEITASFSDMSAKMMEEMGKKTGFIGTIAEGLGSTITALADFPKTVVRMTQQSWGKLGVYLKDAVAKVLAVFADVSTSLLKNQAKRTEPIAAIAGSVGSFITALAEIPKMAVKIPPQNWALLGVNLRAAASAILAAFATLKGLGASATKMGNIASIADSVASIITAFVEITSVSVAKSLSGIKAVRSKTKVLASNLALMVKGFLDVLKARKLVVSEDQTANVGNVFSIGTSIADAVTTFSEMSLSAIAAAIVSLDRVAKKAPAIGAAMARMVAALKTSFNKTGPVADFSGSVASITTIASSVGDTITAYAEITKDMIANAVTGLKLAASNAPAIGKAMFQMVKAMRTELTKLVSDESFTSFTDIADKVVTISNNVAGVITTYAEITDQTIAAAIKGLNNAATNAKPIGEAMRNLVERLQKVFEDMKMKSTFGELVSSVADVSSTIADIIVKFSAVTADMLNKAVTGIQMAAARAPAIGTALSAMVTAIAASFKRSKIDAAFAKELEPVTTLTDAVSSILDLITKLSDPTVQNQMFTFTSTAAKLSGLWGGIGKALSDMFTMISNSLGRINDTGELAKATAALQTLQSVFDALSALSTSIKAIPAIPQVNVPGATTGVPAAPAPVVPAVSAGAAPAAPVQTKALEVNVNISWSSLTGEPSQREKAALVSYIKPELERIAKLAAQAAL